MKICAKSLGPCDSGVVRWLVDGGCNENHDEWHPVWLNVTKSHLHMLMGGMIDLHCAKHPSVVSLIEQLHNSGLEDILS